MFSDTSTDSRLDLGEEPRATTSSGAGSLQVQASHHGMKDVSWCIQ